MNRLNVEDFGGKVVVQNQAELEQALFRRYEGENEIWVFPESESWPALALMINGSHACIQYFPKEGHPGFISQAEGAIDKSYWQMFHVNKTEEQEMPGSTVVPESSALNAAKEFAEDLKLPSILRWLEL
jgi:CRISPR/Cas system-associated endonuclease Cas1